MSEGRRGPRHGGKSDGRPRRREDPPPYPPNNNTTSTSPREPWRRDRSRSRSPSPDRRRWGSRRKAEEEEEEDRRNSKTRSPVKSERDQQQQERQSRMARLRMENEEEERRLAADVEEHTEAGRRPEPSKEIILVQESELEGLDEDEQMKLLMGFSGGFGSTSGKPVEDNQTSAARGAAAKNKVCLVMLKLIATSSGVCGDTAFIASDDAFHFATGSQVSSVHESEEWVQSTS